MKRPDEELRNVSYELFIVAISILAIANIFLYYFVPDRDIAGMADLMNWTLSLLFLLDFIARLLLSESKKTYILRRFGWADLLSVMPFQPAKLLRLPRIIRTISLMRQYGKKEIAGEIKAYPSAAALMLVLLLIILVLEFGGIAVIKAESTAPQATIHTASDALWFIYQTITTVGYGDVTPITPDGRLVGIVVMTLGAALFGTLTGFVTNAFVRGKHMVRRKPKATAGEHKDARQVQLDEIRELVREIKQSQAALEEKIDELEQML